MPGKKIQRHLRWAPPGLYSATEFHIPAHDPPLAPRDEAVFLLHTGAEVEHALLVQYLYAAYSLKSPQDAPEEHASRVHSWKKTLLGIAREEMGHLITVQNLLRLIGGPIILEREDYPFRSHLYPFHFRLEPLTRTSLAKYVVAEMPYMADPPDEVKEIVTRAAAVSAMQVNQVGAIYARIMQLFALQDGGRHKAGSWLSDEDFAPHVHTHEDYYETWGDGPSVLVPDVGNRVEALQAIAELAEQGEGMAEQADSAGSPSHYERFLRIYREFPEPGDWEPTYPVPTDPNFGSYEGMDADAGAGCITHPRSVLWAKLSNLRYRLLLACLSHFLQSEGPLLDDNADYTARGKLKNWTFGEMRHTSQVASKLATLPRVATRRGAPELPGRAGAPFDMPYTLDLPNRDEDRWRSHFDVLSACLELEQSIVQAHPEDLTDPLLEDLIRSDTRAQDFARAASRRETLPQQAQDFQKVVRLLEDGVRGFRIGAHHNFWRDCTRDQFVAASVYGNPLFTARPDGTFDAAGSTLIKALRGDAPFGADLRPGQEGSFFPRMPAEHPPLPRQVIQYIHSWIDRGCPDNDPPGQIGLPSGL
jgi:hypothetical protein